jgi:hypothetical protein
MGTWKSEHCLSVSLPIYPYSFALENGMEEVVGSIPTRSTNSSNNLEEARTYSDISPVLLRPSRFTTRSSRVYRWFR